jgi:hypothetical protein
MSDGDAEYPVLAPHGWESSFREFREVPAEYVRSRLVAAVPDASPEQVQAWDESIPPLQREVGKALASDRVAAEFGAILEYTLPLNHRRPDVLLLMDGSVLVIEAKGKDRVSQADIDQVAAYARDLRAYHESCAEAAVRPILLLTRAVGRLGTQGDVEVIGPDALDAVIRDFAGAGSDILHTREFLDPRRYRPLPSLVKAARELFETGDLRRIHRASAATGPAVAALGLLAREAAETGTRHLALVSGLPGTGKTLVGLSLAHSDALDELAVDRGRGRSTTPAVFLSGNGPLVEVLQYELKSAGGGGRTFVRDVKSYVERYLGDASLVPDEHVVVFDEAQRAWDAAKVAREHRGAMRPGSEPEHLLEFAERIPGWCLIVGLIGSGQEIHDGEEAGVEQWHAALRRVGRPDDWSVTVPPSLAPAFSGWERVRLHTAFDLKEELRFHSAQAVHRHVDGVLAGETAERLRRQADDLERDGLHLRITRDLQVAKRYLRDRYSDNPDARFGLVASSRDTALPRFGVHNDWNATKNVRKGPWFCDGDEDELGRSCRSLVDCVTEFGCQGLELDAALLAWGTDLVREGDVWSNRLARRYQAPHLIRDPYQLRLNAYRVLLTRGRDATVVFVPPIPVLDATYDFLVSAGFLVLDDSTTHGLGVDSAHPPLEASASLGEVVERVRAAPAATRIELRDELAAFGLAALPAVADLAQSGFGGFAIRVARRIAEQSDPNSVAACLRTIDRDALKSAEIGELDTAIRDLAPRAAPRTTSTQRVRAPALAPTELVVGRLYRRSGLHEALGGNRQKGISYPKSGTHVLLFSGGTGREEYGYEDRWIDDRRYAYYGEWAGTGDMTMSGGNAKIVDRSPELYLFVQRGTAGYEFLGRFECVRHERVPAIRDGREHNALVFTLECVADTVKLRP